VPVTITCAVALSMNRLAFGGHFLSAILLSWELTAMVMLALHRMTFVVRPVAACDIMRLRSRQTWEPFDDRRRRRPERSA